MNAVESRIHQRIKTIREKATRLSSKRLSKRLDTGDKHLLLQLLDDLDQRIEYLHHLDRSTCSIVLENCGIEYGQRLGTPQ